MTDNIPDAGVTLGMPEGGTQGQGEREHKKKPFCKLPGILQLFVLSTTALAAGAVIAVTTGGAAHRGMSCQLFVQHPIAINKFGGAGRPLTGGCRC